jgi:hypothetical protein
MQELQEIHASKYKPFCCCALPGGYVSRPGNRKQSHPVQQRGRKSVDARDSLGPREQDVLPFIAQAFNNKEIL